MSNSGSVVLKENFFDDLAKFLYFCYYLPFDLLLVWSKISFPQGWFVPSLIEIGLLVLDKIMFQYKHVNMVFPILAPPNPRGPWRKQFWIYIISESLHVNMTYSGSVVLKMFIWPHPIFAIISPLKRTWPFISLI